jgi:C1A family cysteine protease
MKAMIALTAAVALLSIGLLFIESEDTLAQREMSNITQQEFNEFLSWKEKHGKSYASQEEEMMRMRLFFQTKKFVERENSKANKTVTHGLNQFSDLTKEEFVNTYLGFKPSNETEQTVGVSANATIPNFVNWTQKGAVSAVLNQGKCGSCWSFSAAEAIGSAYAVFKNQTNPVPQLSEQQLVSCATAAKGYLNFGCNGGQMVQAFRYAKSNPLNTYANYGYTSGNSTVNGACNKTLASQGKYGVKGYTAISAGSDALAEFVARQPTSVAVDATNWSTYSSGVFYNCAKNLNHGVLAVGYSLNNYWIVRNSWGTAWGQSGYIQVSWSSNCGIDQSASVPNL